MVGPILKEALVLIVFCHIFVSGKDLLEIFQPSPSLPQELNEWLASVQKHKNDFRLIREVAAKNNKNSFRIEEEDEGGNRRANIQMQLEDQADQKMEDVEEAPRNDVYPYMYKSDNTFDDRKYAPKKASRRLRRSSDNAAFADVKNFVNLEPKSKFGEIERVDEKYPERYKESFSEEQSKTKSNFKEKKEAQDHDKDFNKREVQIEIKKNGKLVKEITDDESSPKSIILNIQGRGEKSHVGVQHFAAANLNMLDNQISQATPSTSPPERSITSNIRQMKDKEFYSNFNNLFSVNEHLNTDSSIARQTATAMGPLVYHVTIPNFVSYPEVSPTYSAHEFQTPLSYGGSKNFPIPLLLPPELNLDTDPQPISYPYNYNHNNFQDMSKYWTASEKNQMEKGIDFARNNDNIKKFLQHVKMPQKMQGQSENETGFEPAQRIEVDNGQLVKINVEEKLNENKGPDIFNYIKRNNAPIQRINGEGVIEIDGQKPTIVLGKPVGNSENSITKNIDAKPSIKEIINNVGPIKKLGNLAVANLRPDLRSRLLKVNGAESKNTIPNIQDIIKPENKRQLEFLQGKIQPIANENDLDDSWNKPALLGGAEKVHAMVGIPNDPSFRNRPLEKSTTNVLGLIESFKDTISQAKIDGSKCGSQIPEDLNNDDSQDDNYENPTMETEIPEDDTSEDEIITENSEEDIEEDIPKCIGANANMAHNSKNGAYLQKSRLGMRHNGIAIVPETEQDAPALDVNEIPQDRLLRLNDVRELSKIDVSPELNNKFREEIREQNIPHNNFRRNLMRSRGKVYQKYDPNLRKIVLIYNNLPYVPVKGLDKHVRFKHRVSKVVEEPNEDSIDQSDWDKNENIVSYSRQRVRHLPPNLFIRKRGNEENEIIMRKRYRKRQHGGSYLGNLVSNSNENIDLPSKPRFIGRRLQNVEYVYDNYDKVGEDYYDISTELQELASESEGRVELLQKDSVEGDYGDEEDSVTDKQKKAEFNIAKKTNNEFANPRTTTENEDDYYNDDYDNCRDKPEDTMSVTDEIATEKRHGDADRPMAMNDRGISSVHHGHMGANKFKTKLTKKHSRLIPVKANKIKIEDKEVGFTRKPSRKSARHRRNRNKKHSGKVSVDRMSEFQHWPTFVIDDQETEEKLGKRSPPLGKYPNVNDFPMASKDFFVKGKSKRKANDGRVRRSTRRPVVMSNPEVEAPLLMEKRETPKSMPITQACHAGNGPTTEEACSPEQMTVTNACEMGETFNNSKVEVATMLAIDSAHDTNENDTSHGIFEKIDDILDGIFPSKVVSDIFDELKQNSKLQRRFNKGLRRSNKNLCFQNLNDTNTEETRKILDSMTCLMNRLQLTATCQVLPRNLRSYLKSITRNRKTDSLAHMRQMKEVNFDDNQNQKNFIFESSPQGGNNFQDKSKILKELLDKFNSLPERCKARGQPVKEYIENHLGILNNMLESSDTPGASASSSAAAGQSCPVKQVQSRSDNTRKADDALVQEQLASLGLGREHRFIPQFDLDKMIENGRRDKAATPELQGKGQPRSNANVNKRDLNSVSRSIKYNKLVDAVRKVKLKRDGERRLAEAFGRSSDYSGFSFNSRGVDSKDVAKASFESPLVYSL